MDGRGRASEVGVAGQEGASGWRGITCRRRALQEGAWPVFEGVASGDRYHSGRPCSWDGTGAPSFCWKETGSGKRVGISRIAQAESKAFSFLGFDFFSLLGRASWKRLRDASRRPQETRISPSAGWFRPVLAPATDGGAGGK